MPDGSKEPPRRTEWPHRVGSRVERRLQFERRDFMWAIGAAAAAGMIGSAPASAGEGDEEYYRKTRPTILTESERENALSNIERYDWAAEIRDQHVENAETILEYWDEEELWRLVPSQLVPRGNALDGSFNKFASTAQGEGWSWPQMDPEFSLYATSPAFDWEITNTFEIEGEEIEVTLPSNDFAAYRESGRDDAGNFDPDLADDSLLENVKNPELPNDWGVDDGTGFVDEEGYIGPAGTQWNPVSWINHWLVIYAIGTFLDELSMAYVLTEDERYARPAAILLDRVGDVYPDLSIRELEEYYDRAYSNSHGGTGQGKFVGAIWESSQIRGWLEAYDHVFPGVDDEVVSFLSVKADEYPEMSAKGSLRSVRENVETGFVHEMFDAFKNAQIRGNFGFHQATLAVAAVCADDPDGMTGEALDYVFRPGTLRQREDGTWESTGGDIFGFLVGSPQSGYIVDEDGYPTESAPHYNTSQQNSVETVADVLRGYDGYEGADLYQNPKFRRAVDSHWQLTFGHHIPQIANTHGVGNPKAVAGATPLNDRTIQSAEFALTGFDEYRTPELAQWTYMLNGLSTDGLELGIFHTDPDGIGDEIADVVDDHGPFPATESTQQAGYGFSGLRAGEGDNLRGVYQYYGRNSFGTGSGHTHRDTLNLGVYGYGLDLAPDLGRQGTDWEGTNLDAWVESTPAHNTVTVDEQNVHPQWVGYPEHFDHTDEVQLVDVDAPRAYPQTDTYRRTTAMVTADKETSYVVDFFHVDGGDDHHFSFHAAPADVSTEGLDLQAQEHGTYEDEDVAFADGGHFSYLYDVERDADPEGGFTVDFDVDDYWEVHDEDPDATLRLTMVTDCDEVALATGRPAEQDTENNPEELPFVLAHREGDDLTSEFTSVLEPYAGERVVESIEEVSVEAGDEDADLDAITAVKVGLADGRTDYVIRSLDRETEYVVDDRLVFKGFVGVYAERDGEREFVYANDATLLRTKGGGEPAIQRNHGRVRGTVEDFTRELSTENELDVKLTTTPKDVDLADLVGEWIRIEPAEPEEIPDDVEEDDRYDNEERDRRNATVQIQGVEPGRGNRATLDVGAHTFIRRYATNDPEDGYSYSIEKGAEFVVPLGRLVD